MPALSFDALLRSLKKGELGPAYYFHGDEDLLKDDAVRDLLAAALEPSTRDFNLDRRRAADLTAEEFTSLALTPPMLAARRTVVVQEAEALQQRRPRSQALRAAVLAFLERPAPDTLVVLVQSAGEKPDADLARLAAAVAFDPLPPNRVARWIRHRARAEGLEIEEEAALHLHAAVGDELAQISAEIAKLGSAVQGRAATVDDVADLVGVRHGETVYDFVGAVTARRFAPAAGMVPHLVASPGSSGVRLVSALATALVGVALARSLLEEGGARAMVAERLLRAIQAARPMGLGSWREDAQRWTRDAAAWPKDALDAALAELLRADKRLKSGALADESAIVVDALLSMAAYGKAAA